MRVRARTIILGLIALVAVLLLAAISAVGWQVVLGPKARAVTAQPLQVTDARLARGKYLVEGPLNCFHCHSEHDLTQPEMPPIAGRKGVGWLMPVPELGKLYSRNITSDPETGLGKWSDDEIARAIAEGVSKDGRALFPVMPYYEFATLDDEDLASVVVYLRTVPPIKNAVPDSHLIFPLNILVKTMPKPKAAPTPSHPSATPVERGKYLVEVSGCHTCHTPTDDKGRALPGLDFAGGGKFYNPLSDTKTAFSANLTSDPSGIPHYDEALFLQTIRTGQLGGRTLSHIMPFESLQNMTEGDLKDVFAFLKSLAPIKHRVDNSTAPTDCPICKQKHGLGALNR